MKLAYTINEACEAIGIKRTMLYREITAGRLEPRKIGNKTIILADDLNQYMKTRPLMKNTPSPNP